MDLMVLYVDDEPPSTMYVASVQGAPTNPSTAAVSPIFAQDAERLAHVGNVSRSSACIIFNPAAVAGCGDPDRAFVVVDLERDADRGQRG